MSYQILPNIIFIFSILGILLIILRHLPEATIKHNLEIKEPPADQKLQAKGLPAEAFSKVGSIFKLWTKKAWNFILEAKDMKPHAVTGYQMKKIFGGKLPTFKKPAAKAISTREVKDEKYYLELIKLQPKNYEHYDSLGKFYLERENFSDAKDIYQYLVNHQPANPDFHARLAYCCYRLKQYPLAAEHYRKSLALDSTQPNRYYNLGLSLESSGKLAEAITSFQQAISLEPKNSKYYLSLSNAYAKQGDTKKAKDLLFAAQEFDPENELVKGKLQKYL
ncbi:MAG: tetratricopeptide repeat protein [Candidatus Doudnabacteria bacterium]|nr:tetratricopeptide repeat protein [Candidatus Doudnabacteria bacterium]